MYTYVHHYIIEGSLEAKLSTTWADEAAEVGRGREEKARRKKINVREKVRNHGVFPMFRGSGAQKVGSLKRRVQSHLVG
jgi:hypothetical protein